MPRRPAAPPSSWIVCIGTRHRAKRRPSANIRASAQTVTTASPGAPAQLGQQLGIAVQGGHLEPRSGQLERDATGAGADVEHGPATLGSQLRQTGEIGRVGPALEVVPDHAQPALTFGRSRPHAHGWPPPERPETVTCPRRRELLAQLEQGRIGGQDEQPPLTRRGPPHGRARSVRLGSTCSRSAGSRRT